MGPEDCTPFTPEPRHIIAYHYVTDGTFLLRVDDQAPISVGAGEIVVLPRNNHHVIGSALNLRPVSAEHLIRPNPDGGLAQIVHGGGGKRTHILCGFLGNDMPRNTLIAMLPSLSGALCSYVSKAAAQRHQTVVTAIASYGVL